MIKGYTAHMVVKNEDVWVWFAIQSILPYVDKMLIYDTGSTDKTVEIIKSIKSPKIIFEQRNLEDPKKLTFLRKEQIQKTNTEWIIIVDGDEIWPKQELKKLLEKSEKTNKDTVAIINRNRNCIGDVYHYLPEHTGHYSIAGYYGNLNIRVIRNSNDLTITGDYPLEVYSNKNGILQSQQSSIEFVDCWYLHTSFLQRSSNDKNKKSGSYGKKRLPEQGIALETKELPEVFFTKFPNIVKNPLQKRSVNYEFMAQLITPLLEIKRKFK